MKKLIVLVIALMVLILSCNKAEVIEMSQNEIQDSVLLKQKTQTELTTPFVQMVAETFNKMVQSEKVWKGIEAVIQDDIAMITSAGDEENDTIKDDIIRLSSESYGVFEDNIMMKASTIREDIIIGYATFEDVFIETFKALHPESDINYDRMLKRLPKLYYGLPISAFEDYDQWKESGCPITVKSYSLDSYKLKEVSVDEVKKTIGGANFENLIAQLERRYNTFYLSKEQETTIVLNTDGVTGSYIEVNEDKAILGTFKVEDKGHYNTIVVQVGETSIEVPQSYMHYQTYVDIIKPDPCSGFYAFKCGSPELATFLAEQQQLANTNCETYYTCLPLCCNYGIIYAAFQFEPTSIRCAKALPYISELSFTSL